MKETISNEEEMANLYYKLYNGCINFKNENKKTNKQINCHQFLILYEKFSNKENKNNKSN